MDKDNLSWLQRELLENKTVNSTSITDPPSSTNPYTLPEPPPEPLPAESDLPAEPETGLYSEHGHRISRVRPLSKHSGSSVATFFNGLFATIIGIATLGASVTFSYVLSNNVQPPSSSHPTFDAAQVQLFLALSWLLFLLALAFASLGSTLLTFFKDHWKADWDG